MTDTAQGALPLDEPFCGVVEGIPSDASAAPLTACDPFASASSTAAPEPTYTALIGLALFIVVIGGRRKRYRIFVFYSEQL